MSATGSVIVAISAIGCIGLLIRQALCCRVVPWSKREICENKNIYADEQYHVET